MQSTVDDYEIALPIELPIQHEKGFSIASYTIKCAKCAQPTEDLRGECIPHSECLEMRAAGVCHKCKVITWSRARYYGDRFLIWQNRRIVEFWPKISWHSKIKGLLKQLNILRGPNTKD